MERRASDPRATSGASAGVRDAAARRGEKMISFSLINA